MANILIVCLTLLLSACIAKPVNIETYARQKPTFSVKNFFQGHLQGYGALTDNKTRLVNQLNTALDVRWQGNDGLMNQIFHFKDGQDKKRQWCIHIIDEHHFSLISNFYEGRVAGLQYGNVMHMVYHVKLPSTQNYYNSLHNSEDFWQSVNNSPEHAIYSLITSGSIIGEVKAAARLQKTTSAWLKIPQKIAIGDYCAAKDKQWSQERAAIQSYAVFELDNWFFMIEPNVVIQQTAVKERNNKLGELNMVMLKGFVNQDRK